MNRKTEPKRIFTSCLAWVLVWIFLVQGLVGVVWAAPEETEPTESIEEVSVQQAPAQQEQAPAEQPEEQTQQEQTQQEQTAEDMSEPEEPVSEDIDSEDEENVLSDEEEAQPLAEGQSEEGEEEDEADEGEAADETEQSQDIPASDEASDAQPEASEELALEEETALDQDGETLAGNYIYFDLYAGSVTITGSTYEGYVYEDGKITKVTGTHDSDNQYYIYQSEAGQEQTTGLVDGQMVLPQYDAVTYNGIAWGEYITNNSSVEDVITNWETAAAAAGRKSTGNGISISGASNVTVVFDNLWSSYAPSNAKGPVSVTPSSSASVTIQLKGDSRFRNIYYSNNRKDAASLNITSAAGDGQNSGTMTVAALSTEMNSTTWPDMLAVIGASNTDEYGLTFQGGTVFAGFPAQNNRVWGARGDVLFATCVGGGNNHIGQVTITGGRLTAVSNGTSPAIGGGGGYKLAGGYGLVNISGGEVYAYAMGIYSTVSDCAGFVPTSAIGGSSTFLQTAKDGTVVEISGGYVYASSLGGTAIGGGGSMNSTGGSATVTISGNAVVEAYSVAGTAHNGSYTVEAGNAIGGGVGTNGGAAVVTITGGTTTATAIGGGMGRTGNGGNATVTITGGTIRTGTIGGGSTNSATAHVGFACATISGGDIQGQFLLKGLNTGKEADRCKFIMTGGKIHDVSTSDPAYPDRKSNGGAVWMDDSYGIVTISGGSIENCSAENGGAIYMTEGTFTLSGGSIQACRATAADGRGGGVYLGGGRAVLSGGSIQGCTAVNGGGIYVSGADGAGNAVIAGTEIDTETDTIANTEVNPDNYNVYISGGSISGNTASQNGGGICVNNGHVLMDGGSVDDNSAKGGSGGGIYLSSIARDDARIRVRSGSISGNYASVSGGAIALDGNQDASVTLKVTIGVNVDHYDDSDNYVGCAHTYADQQNNTCSPCPKLENNRSVESGGAIYITGGSTTKLNIYCLMEKNNDAAGDEDQSNFMMVCGGTVIITTGSKTENGNAENGYTEITGTIHILGGSLDIYGQMKNPQIDDVITVDLQSADDHFEDHRILPAGDENLIFWVFYYENFLVTNDDGTSYRTGRFKAVPVMAEDNYEHTIRSTLFERSGYVIMGWHTTMEGEDTGEQTDNAYEVGDTYSFSQDEKSDESNVKTIQTHKTASGTEVSDLISNASTDGQSEGQLTTLVLYAIWKKGAYSIHFDANAVSYSGTMENMACEMNTYHTLNANGFSVFGKKFASWNTQKDGSGQAYTDMAQVIDLAAGEGEVITLYAQWTDCDHTEGLVYTAAGDTIIQQCAVCGSDTATATIGALDAVYDGEPHLATVTYGDGWLGEKTLEASITYTMAADAQWDTEDTVADDWNQAENPQPVHAGQYTASIAVTVSDDQTVTASTDYQITPTVWPALESPVIAATNSADDGNTVTITSPTGDGLLYRMTYVKAGQKEESQWTSENTFEINTYNVFYYFYVKKQADRDHKESAESVSPAYLSNNGISVIFQVSVGILLTAEEGSGNLTFQAYADEGYHLRNYKAVAILGDTTMTLDITPNEDGVYTNILQQNLADKSYTNSIITITITGVAKDASVTAKYTSGQVFSDFNGKTVSISADSAFTAQFTVSDIIPQEYCAQKLTFGQGLPAGTTIIMKTAETYWYYKATQTVSELDLKAFTAMGSTETFSYDTEGGEAVSLGYQFVVDFSQVSAGARLSEGELSVSLGLTPATDSVTTEASGPAMTAPEVSGKVTVALVPPGAFSMTASAEGRTADVQCTYTASGGAASVWSGRKAALVLTAPDTVPADLSMTVKVGTSTTVYTMNSKRQFIIPLGALASKSVSITLSSALFPKQETSYAFTVAWYVSASGAASAPINGYQAASQEVIFTAQQAATPSLRVDNTNRLLHVGDNLCVTLSLADIPAGATVKAELLQKNKTSGTYVNTSYKLPEPVVGENRYTLNGLSEGSFCLRYTVSLNGVTLLRVPTYFVVRP